MRSARLGFLLTTMVSVGACSPAVSGEDAESTSTSTGAVGTGSTSSVPPNPTTANPATTASPTTATSSSAESTGAADEGCGFVGCDDHAPPEDCDFWNDDCPEGEKCTFWAIDGGGSWNATRCVPLERDPAGPGEPCTASGIATGYDNCDTGSMCWGVDDDGQGTCIAFCIGSPEAPTCAAADEVCSIAGGPLAICIPTCDPLEDETCPDGQGCYSDGWDFFCGPDHSEPDGGGTFEPCTYFSQCDPGSLCAPDESVGACLDPDEERCCTPWCDLTNPDCPDGTTCQPFFPDAEAPEGHDDVGFCGQEEL